MSNLDNEIYEMLDRCGLTASSLLTSKQSMQNTVNAIRMQLAKEIGQLVDEKVDRAVENNIVILDKDE